MTDGQWPMTENRSKTEEADKLVVSLLVIGHWSLVISHWSLVIGHRPSGIRHPAMSFA